MRIGSKAALLASFGLGALAATVLPALSREPRHWGADNPPAVHLETVQFQPPQPAPDPPSLPVIDTPTPGAASLPAEPLPPPTLPSPTTAPVPIVPAPAPAADPADPERAAEQYVEKTRAEAAAAVATLRAEANTLRERLRRVEAALSRWESLVSALDLNRGPAPGGVEPALEPIPAKTLVPPPLPEPALDPATIVAPPRTE